MENWPELMTPLKMAPLPEDLHGELKSPEATECSPLKLNVTTSPTAAVSVSGVKTSPSPPTVTVCVSAIAPAAKARRESDLSWTILIYVYKDRMRRLERVKSWKI